jgi:hypothetical protein
MWNWKPIYEDKGIACYLDIDNIIDLEEDQDGLYHSVECYTPIFKRAGAWVTVLFKQVDMIEEYKRERQRNGLATDGYDDYSSSLCLIDIDCEQRLYRVIPVTDHDGEGKILGHSTIVSEKEGGLIPGISSEWSPIYSENTNEVIQKVFQFISGSPDGPEGAS